MLHEHPFEAAIAAQRVAARGELGLLHAGGRTRIDRLYQEGAAKIRMPRTAGDPFEAVLINTAGGLTGGDRLDWSISVGAGASATVTTQTCEKIYRAASGIAKVGCRMSVGDGGRLAWLPQETIVFDNSAFRRTIEVDLAADAEALIVEATVLGRRAMGESVVQASFADRWRVRREGRLVHAEDFAIGPDAGKQLAAPPALGSASCVATVLVSGRRCRAAARCRARHHRRCRRRQRLDGRGVWQASCEAHRRRQLPAAQAADPADRTAQRAGRPAQSLDTLGEKHRA